MTEPRHAILDVVEPLADAGRWPGGSVGTVVEADAEQVLADQGRVGAEIPVVGYQRRTVGDSARDMKRVGRPLPSEGTLQIASWSA